MEHSKVGAQRHAEIPVSLQSEFELVHVFRLEAGELLRRRGQIQPTGLVAMTECGIGEHIRAESVLERDVIARRFVAPFRGEGTGDRPGAGRDALGAGTGRVVHRDGGLALVPGIAEAAAQLQLVGDAQFAVRKQRSRAVLRIEVADRQVAEHRLAQFLGETGRCVLIVETHQVGQAD